MAEFLNDRDILRTALPSNVSVYPMSMFLWSKLYDDVGAATGITPCGENRGPERGNRLSFGNASQPPTLITQLFQQKNSIGSAEKVALLNVRNSGPPNENKSVQKDSWVKNTWYAITGRLENATTRNVWLGPNEEEDLSGDNVTSFSAKDVAIGDPVTPSNFPNGVNTIAWCMLWTATLSDQDITSMTNGVNPFIIAHDDQVFAAPLYGNDLVADDALPKFGKDHNQSIDNFTTYTNENGDGQWNIGVTTSVEQFKIDTTANHLQVQADGNGDWGRGTYYPRGTNTATMPTNSNSDTFSNEKWLFKFSVFAATMVTTINGRSELGIGLGNTGNLCPEESETGPLFDQTVSPLTPWQWLGLIIYANPTSNDYELWIGQKINHLAAIKSLKFDTTISDGDTLHFEMVRRSRSRFGIRVYSDAPRVLLEERWINCNLLHYNYLKVAIGTLGGAALPVPERGGDGFEVHIDDLELFDSQEYETDPNAGREPDEFINQLSFTKSSEYKPTHAAGPPVEPLENYI